MPAPVTAPGLPARRFWEFEDGNLNLAALQPGELPADGRTLVLVGNHHGRYTHGGALRAALASLGFEITSVGDAGYLLERSGATT